MDIGVNIFPNPFNNQTSIELRLLSNSIVIKIYDISGSLIKTNNYNCKKGNNKLSLIFDDYASGIFFVKFFVKSYSVNKERIILKKIIHLK